MGITNIFKQFFNQIREAPLDKPHAGPLDVFVADTDTPPLPTYQELMNHGNTFAFEDGYYDFAKRVPLHTGRLGRDIIPAATVVHTTDTMPGGFGAIVKSWGTTAGLGNAAHFLLGRTEVDGLVQFAPITKNANHAGGASHGWWKLANGDKVHPNLISVGIEIDNAGKLKMDGSTIIHPDTHKEISKDQVYWDDKGHPWHKITNYQVNSLRDLLGDLALIIKRPWMKGPANYVVSNGDYISNSATWAIRISAPWLVGHATLDPYNKTDPGPEVMNLLRKWYPEYAD